MKNKIEYITSRTSLKNTARILSKRIEKGVKFLDKVKGKNWIRNIDLKKLNLEDTNVCVCGQLFIDYWEAENKHFESNKDIAAIYGFNSYQFDYDEEIFFDILTNLWYCRILSLRLK